MWWGLKILFFLSTNKILNVPRNLQIQFLDFFMNVLLIPTGLLENFDLSLFFFLLTNFQKEYLAFISQFILVFLWFIFNCFSKNFKAAIIFFHVHGFSSLGRKRVLPIPYLHVLSLVVWHVCKLFLSTKLCIAFSITNTSDNLRKLFPRD